MKKVITYGTYDLLHFGHIRLLKRAKALGDYLIVGVTSDDFDKSRGKINVQQSLMERVAAVKATGIADEIIVEEYEGQKIDDIRKHNVDIFTVTDTGTKLVLPNKPEIHGLGVFVDVFPIYNAPPVEEREEWYRQYAALRQKMLYTVPGTAHYQGPKLKSMVRYAKRIPKRIKYKSRNYSQYCAEITALLNRYENSGTGDVVVMDTPYGLKTVMERKIFESAAEVEFEGGKFLAPVLYEEYLTKLYGDYMKLPPVEKRVSSHGFQAYWNK